MELDEKIKKWKDALESSDPSSISKFASNSEQSLDNLSTRFIGVLKSSSTTNWDDKVKSQIETSAESISTNIKTQKEMLEPIKKLEVLVNTLKEKSADYMKLYEDYTDKYLEFNGNTHEKDDNGTIIGETKEFTNWKSNRDAVKLKIRSAQEAAYAAANAILSVVGGDSLTVPAVQSVSNDNSGISHDLKDRNKEKRKEKAIATEVITESVSSTYHKNKDGKLVRLDQEGKVIEEITDEEKEAVEEVLAKADEISDAENMVLEETDEQHVVQTLENGDVIDVDRNGKAVYEDYNADGLVDEEDELIYKIVEDKGTYQTTDESGNKVTYGFDRETEVDSLGIIRHVEVLSDQETEVVLKSTEYDRDAAYNDITGAMVTESTIIEQENGETTVTDTVTHVVGDEVYENSVSITTVDSEVKDGGVPKTGNVSDEEGNIYTYSYNEQNQLVEEKSYQDKHNNTITDKRVVEEDIRKFTITDNDGTIIKEYDVNVDSQISMAQMRSDVEDMRLQAGYGSNYLAPTMTHLLTTNNAQISGAGFDNNQSFNFSLSEPTGGK